MQGKAMDPLAFALSMDAAGAMSMLFGILALVVGIALVGVACACARMGLPGARRVSWFAAFSVAGGLWSILDPAFILPLLPYPLAIGTLSGLLHHALAFMVLGYVRACVDVRTGRVVAAFMAVELCMLSAELASQMLGGPTVFELSDVTVAVQMLLLAGLVVALIEAIRRGSGPEDVRGVLVLIPCLVGILLEAACFMLGAGKGGPWFGLGFIVTVAVQVGLFLRYVKEQADEAARARELERELARKRLSIMLSQIQPHFLYNALGTIQYLCETDPSLAARTVNSFARYLQGNMASLTQEFPVPLERDVEHLRHYLAIEKLRFPEVSVELDLRDTLFGVPPLTLQPLVENAIQHGLCGRKGGVVRVSSWEEDDAHCIAVTDDGRGFDASLPASSGEKTGVGLANTAERVRLMCGGSLDVRTAPGEGTIVSLRFPKRP